MSFLKGFFTIMGANITLFVLTYINYKLLYIYLSESDNGFFFVIMRFSLLLALFFGDWMRLSSMNIAGKDKSIIPILSANVFWYTISLGFALLFCTLLISSFFNGSIVGLSFPHIFIIIIVGTILIARKNWQSLLLVNHRIYSYGFTFIIWGGLFLLLNVFFLLILKYELNSVLIALIIASFVSTIWAFVSNLITNGHSFRPSWKVLKLSGKIGERAWIAIFGMFLMGNIHVFSINPLSKYSNEGWAMVGIFSVCFRIFSLFQIIADVAGTVLYSHVVQKNGKTGFLMTKMVSRNILFISLMFAAACILLGKTLILIISSFKYGSAYKPLLLMLPGIVAINTGSVMNSYFWGRNYPKKIIFAPYVAVVIGLVLNIILIPRFGVSGATLSFSVMSILWFIYETACFLNDTSLKLHEVLVPRFSDVKFVLSRINRKN